MDLDLHNQSIVSSMGVKTEQTHNLASVVAENQHHVSLCLMRRHRVVQNVRRREWLISVIEDVSVRNICQHMDCLMISAQNIAVNVKKKE